MTPVYRLNNFLFNNFCPEMGGGSASSPHSLGRGINCPQTHRVDTYAQHKYCGRKGNKTGNTLIYINCIFTNPKSILPATSSKKNVPMSPMALHMWCPLKKVAIESVCPLSFLDQFIRSIIARLESYIGKMNCISPSPPCVTLQPARYMHAEDFGHTNVHLMKNCSTEEYHAILSYWHASNVKQSHSLMLGILLFSLCLRTLHTSP